MKLKAGFLRISIILIKFNILIRKKEEMHIGKIRNKIDDITADYTNMLKR